MNGDTEMAAAALLDRLDPMPEGRLLAGVSGGADSVMLLYLLVMLRDKGRAAPEVIHVNHGWRGDESDGDERFVRDSCLSYGVPCHVYRLPEHTAHDENTAREFRRRFFAECAEETGIRKIVLAHQMDDQAETFLMRLLRGAGPDGLEAMRSVAFMDGLTVIRPMLGFTRDEIRRFLSSAGVRWREDSSNARSIYLRNRIRQQLLPAAEDIAPGCVERIARATGLIAEQNDALDEYACRLLKTESGRGWFRKSGLRAAPKQVAVRALRKWAGEYSGGSFPMMYLDYDTTACLYALAAGDARAGMNLPGGLHAVSAGRFVFLIGIPEKPLAPVTCVRPETVFGEHTLSFTASLGSPGDGLRAQEVPTGFTDGCVIRTRRTGDYIYPFGSRARQSLSDYLTNRKVEAPWRGRIPLVVRGQEVFWVAGVGTGRLPRLDGSTDAERLVWSGGMPWFGDR